MVMYDSLNRNMLEPYGCDWIRTPNFKRLAQKTVTFDCNYVGSMPCMPARRELHTGRYNFEHRSWGPIEPFDISMPEILKNNGIFSMLSTDHYHYWEDGGATYHNRYSVSELSRGQEGDKWKVSRDLIDATRKRAIGTTRDNWYDKANREFIDCEEKMPQAKTFGAGIDFLERFHNEQDFFLQIETFDPHEPFFVQKAYKDLFPDDYRGDIDDWPPYYFVTEGEDAVKHIRNSYAALITMCDHYLGKILDIMDKYDMWKDTMLIVNTDHGFLLGEHGWWSKSIMPFYEEISHTPLFIHDPRCPEADGKRRKCLTQTIDLAPTILEFFNLDIPSVMQGKPLKNVISSDEKIRDYALFGDHEGHCNITDGNYVYMRAPIDNAPFYDYTLMPTHMSKRFSTDELKDMELSEGFTFTNGCKVLKIKASEGMNHLANFGTKLYNLKDDPRQEKPLQNPEKELELANEMLRLMREDECPTERLKRFGMPLEGELSLEDIETFHEIEEAEHIPESMSDYTWERGASNMYACIGRFMPPDAMSAVEAFLKGQSQNKSISVKDMMDAITNIIPMESRMMILYFAMLASRTV